ncbi:hypothetical protein B0T25DRAFT_573124 [Lasiosphaeria hispida]|uniref:Uncharacterized protein n=1 Tax=Lasiosphaeria hispida TaxID=260671 RepID=A0AAJ0H9B1_9PEZI|nr:hypothetical protein B0T25DRAFT_573124 [Lasiosphaeria hispida]
MAPCRKQQRPLIQLSFFFLILCSASSAWASSNNNNNGVAQEEALAWRRADSRIKVDVTVPEGELDLASNKRPIFWERVDNHQDAPQAAAQPAHVVRDCQAMITPAPSLLSRQDQGQIQALSNQLQQVSEQSRSVSRASQQVSQSSQQLSQSLQQASQRLSETERQLTSARAGQNAAESASRSLSQAAAEASRQVDEVRQSADRAISAASRSANEAMSNGMASATRSFASVLAQASQSVASVVGSAASMAQKAQAEATSVRNEASSQVQQAQGAALSVTQTALAVVGGIIGSSLLTVVAFFLILRYRRSRQRRRSAHMRGASRAANISYPELKGSSSNAASGGRVGGYRASDVESNYSTDDSGYRVDIKEPLPVAVQGSLSRSGTVNGRGTPGVGYALSYYGPGQPGAVNNNTSGGNGMGGVTMSTGSNNKAGGFRLGDAPRGKFTLFPKSNNGSQENMSSASGPPSSAISTTMTASSSGSGRGSPLQQQQPRSSKSYIPSLDTWLRAGTVSPFGTIRKAVSPDRR